MLSSSECEFGLKLKNWRRLRGRSQLDLALDARVSARHISFLETGRSSPSREMVLRLADALVLPLRDRNELLWAAGFAPRYPERALEDASLESVRQALYFILRMSEPYPAFVLNRGWDIILWNRPHEVLMSKLLPSHDVRRMNAFELVFDRRLLRDRLTNWNEVAAALLRRLRRQMSLLGGSPALERLWKLGVSEVEEAGVLPLDPAGEENTILVPLSVELEGRTLSWFSTLATFGAARDVTLEELVIECFYPADEATRGLVDIMLARRLNESPGS